MNIMCVCAENSINFPCYADTTRSKYRYEGVEGDVPILCIIALFSCQQYTPTTTVSV